MVPASLRGLAFPSNPSFDSSMLSSDGEFRMQPHYVTQRPLDAILLKADAGLDDFVSEKYHDKIAAILAKWSSGLLRSPKEVGAVENTLTADFAASSLLPVDSRLVRPGPAVEVHQNRFASQTSLGRDAFLRELRSRMNGFSKLVTVEFQVTNIAASPGFNSQPPPRVHTRVRYELAGTGHGFHREQLVGYWDLEWESQSSSPALGEFELRRWQALDETQSRSSSPIFRDMTATALGGNSSYSAQMLRGVDHWRTVLDGACGIDIYGHNGVSVADIDNDGFDDLYICQPAGLPNRLYRNRGDGT
ncbi:MAG: VCBS repeat-containing protein, partial [Candidatus Sulfotelmatobacter sp.]